MMTPIDIRPSPCPSQAPQGSAYNISPPYVATFQSKARADAKANLNYLVHSTTDTNTIYSTVSQLILTRAVTSNSSTQRLNE